VKRLVRAREHSVRVPNGFRATGDVIISVPHAAVTALLHWAMIRVFRALDRLSSVSSAKLMAQKTKFRFFNKIRQKVCLANLAK